MDDKRFNEIMNQYVAGKSRGQEVDFRKLNEKEEQALQRRRQYKLAFSIVPIILVIIIALAVALPLTLPNANNEDATVGDDSSTPAPPVNDNYYFEFQNIEQTIITLEELSSTYGITATVPTISNLGQTVKILKTNSNEKIIGVFLDTSVYNEYLDSITLYILPVENNITMLEAYEKHTQETSWNDCIVKYYIKKDVESENYNAQFFFTLGKYKYYLNTTYYGDLDTATILDLIF